MQRPQPRRGRPAPLAGLPLLAGLFALASCGGEGSAGTGGRAPVSPLDVAPRHLLLVTLSGVRADHLSAYQYPRPTSAWPTDGAQRALGRALAIDDLAERGLVCAEAYTTAEDELSALKALFTGRGTPFGEVVSGLEPEHATLAERLWAAGLVTAAFVSGERLARAGGFDQGFGRFEHRPDDAECLTWAYDWLTGEDLGDGRGRFLWLHLAGALPPHEPGRTPPVPGPQADALDYEVLFADPVRTAALPAVDYAALYPRPRAVPGEPGGASDGRIPLRDLYDGELAELAARLRNFLQAYRSSGRSTGLFEDTAVVLAGLSGTGLGEHGYGTSLYAPAARVPLVFHHPRTVPGRRISAQPVALSDLAPTALDWLGLGSERAESPRRGRSLLELLVGAERPLERPVVTVGARGEQAASLREGRMTLVWRGGEGGERIELYDRGLDPLELTDLAPERARLATELRNRLVWLLTEVEP